MTINTPGGQVGGTVQKFGVGVVDSFFFNGLSSDQDVTNALASLDSAMARFSIDKLPFTGAAVALEGRLGQFNAKIKDLDKKISSITSDMISEKAATDKALKAKIQIQQNMLALTVGSSGAMVDLLIRGTKKDGRIQENVKN